MNETEKELSKESDKEILTKPEKQPEKENHPDYRTREAALEGARKGYVK